jgi:hypothetical protein
LPHFLFEWSGHGVPFSRCIAHLEAGETA